MGGDFSKGRQYREAAKYGQIFLQTEKPTYYGGDTVRGNIYLNLLLPYPGKQLYIKLKGKEGVHLVQQRPETYYENVNGQQQARTRYVDELYEEHEDVINMLVPLYTWDALMPGQWVIPFAFMLPQTLPSSFFQEGNRYLAHISYQLEAILEPFNKKEPKLKYKQDMIVREPMKNTIVQNYTNEINTKIKSCCCCDQGSNNLKVNFEKNWYAPGEIAQVQTQLDNTSSKINNTNIVFSLKQKLRLSARGRTENKNFDKVKKVIGGVQAGGKSDSNLIALNLPSFQGGDYRKIKTFSMKGYLLSLKEDPNVLHPATRSKLISSEYYLEVACPMDGCCATTPAVSCPVEIYYPDIQLVQVTAPSGWAPQQVEAVNVSFAPPAPVMGQSDVSISVSVNTDLNASLMQNQMMGSAYQPGQSQVPGNYQPPLQYAGNTPQTEMVQFNNTYYK